MLVRDEITKAQMICIVEAVKQKQIAFPILGKKVTRIQDVYMRELYFIACSTLYIIYDIDGKNNRRQRFFRYFFLDNPKNKNVFHFFFFFIYINYVFV